MAKFEAQGSPESVRRSPKNRRVQMQVPEPQLQTPRTIKPTVYPCSPGGTEIRPPNGFTRSGYRLGKGLRKGWSIGFVKGMGGTKIGEVGIGLLRGIRSGGLFLSWGSRTLRLPLKQGIGLCKLK